jgi:hypothetical protein
METERASTVDYDPLPTEVAEDPFIGCPHAEPVPGAQLQSVWPWVAAAAAGGRHQMPPRRPARVAAQRNNTKSLHLPT